MANLLRKPQGAHGKVHDITPESAEWGYVGFGLYRLKPGDTVSERTDATEDFGDMGERMSVFDKLPPHCVYVPAESDWIAMATTDCVLAVCTAPGKPGRKAQKLGPEGLTLEQRGKGANTRYIHNIAMEGRDVADSLLVTEVFTPQGNWSSYPPHRHDEDNYPDMTYLEETYYHRLNPAQGYGIQRVFTEDGSLDETMAVSDGDVVLVPKGHHPCGSPYGYEMYYLNVMAGPLRKWRFKNHPDHDWIFQRDNPTS
jgi:5-deoxy-glucuronate isomerase